MLLSMILQHLGLQTFLMPPKSLYRILSCQQPSNIIAFCDFFLCFLFIGTFSCEITIPLEIVNTAFSLDTISPNIFNGHNKTSIFPEYQTAGTPLLFFSIFIG